MIPHYKMILYTTNLMPTSRQVMRHALGIAKRFDARIYIVHVLPEMDPSRQNYIAAVIGEKQYKEQSEALHKQMIEKIEDRLKNFTDEELQEHPEYINAVAGIEVLHGHPTDRILDLAERLEADLLIFGSHKNAGGLLGILGSVVKRVLRRSDRPVLVVPVGESPEPA